ncbi:MAG: BMC domain-containing protein [Candidatus Sumerlaeaceae bacterium]|nr:BMC domain-containing protein [Candidatus Sumerlaeaceae bacterium]
MGNRDALGLIETRGYVGLIAATDAAAKAAEVRVVARQKADGGLVTIFLHGDVASVKAAVEAGSRAAQMIGELISAHVIARPAEGIDLLEGPSIGGNMAPTAERKKK